jgi:hypothetical protein
MEREANNAAVGGAQAQERGRVRLGGGGRWEGEVGEGGSEGGDEERHALDGGDASTNAGTAVRETPGGWIPHLICQARPRRSSLLRGMEERAEAAVTAPRLREGAGAAGCAGSGGGAEVSG